MGFDFTSLANQRRFEMPSSWRVITVKDVATVNELSIQGNYPHNNIEYIDIASVERGVINSIQELPLSDAPSRAKRIVRDNDILISTVRPNLEHYTFVKGAKPNTVASTGFAVVSAKSADPRYLYYYLTAKPFTAYLSQIADSHTSAYPAINPDVIETAELLLPSPAEQQAIAHILGTLDDKIELNRRMNQTLEAMAQALFKSWFVDFEPFRDQGMQDSPLGEIPVGWKVGILGDIAENPRRGIQPDRITTNTPYIALEHVPRRCIALAEWGQADEVASNKFEFARGEILFGKLRPYFHKVGVAPVNGVCSTDILVITTKKPGWFGLVLGHISSVEFVSHTDAASSGTKMPRTNWHDMARYRVVLPPEHVAEAFTERVRPLIDRITANIYESHTLAAIRDALLPKLLAGEILIKAAEKFVEKAI